MIEFTDWSNLEDWTNLARLNPMENSITAAADNIVTYLHVAEGDLVEANKQMIAIEEKYQ
jgi:hypothetical protein